MFQPNIQAQLRRRIGRDVHGRATYDAPVSCPAAVVNLDIGAIKTSVRADSSASRGSADETASMRARMLVAPYVPARVDDLILFEDETYLITSIHKRRTVGGQLDHLECTLEVFPG